ncbi:hypothetical protein GF361_03095 [Candidatus Woesearchaeota archaeon]|nr:hypothetical protein [Candidatus Woesearchaeota archaeon]
MKPEIKKIGYEGKDFVSLDVVVNLHMGICMDPSSRIMRECRKYEGKVYMIRDDDEHNYTADCKRMTDIMSLGAITGTDLQILVEGIGEEAEKLALRLYSGITCGDSYEMNFERWE